MTILDKYTVKFWGGPKDGAIDHQREEPLSDYYLTVKDASEVKSIEPGMEFHHYVKLELSGYVVKYEYKGVVKK